MNDGFNAGATAKRPQIDRLADQALEDLENVGLEYAMPEERALALQAAVYRLLKDARGRTIVIPVRSAFAFGLGRPAGS